METGPDLNADELARILEAREREMARLDRNLAQLEAEMTGEVPHSDPRLDEILHRQAVIERRVDHTRCVLENLEKKIEGLARVTADWMEYRSAMDRRSEGASDDRLRVILVAALIVSTVAVRLLIDFG